MSNVSPKPEDSKKDAQTDEAYRFFDFARAILTLIRPYWIRYLVVIVAFLLQIAFYLAFPLGLQLIFDRAIGENDLRILVIVLVGLSIGFVISSVASLGQDYIVALTGAKVIRDLRLKMFDHLQRLSTSFYQRVPAGDLMSRFSNDLNSIQDGVVSGLPLGFYNVLLAVSSIALLFLIEWRLALATLVASPIAIIGPELFGSRASKWSSRRKQEEARVSNVVQENIGGQEIIKAFGLEKPRRILFQEHLVALARSGIKLNFFSALVGRTSNLSVFLLIIIIIGVGAVLVIRGFLTIGGLLAFVGLLLNVDEASRGLADVVPNLLQGVGGMGRVEELLIENPQVADSPQASPLPPFAKEIRFEDVSFSYTGDEPHLKGVNLTIGKGQSVAFVGSSGCGKSTILNLLMRFYDPDEGRVAFDDVDLRQVTQDSLRSQISIVFQDTFLFNTSIGENIRQGRAGANDEEVEAAARAAEIHDLIMNLPQGYNTNVDERGGNLSGGQRQRLALARAILRDPQILILDEATSSLDPGTEAAINHTLKKLAVGRTVISVTHRLAPIVDMDRIYVMEEGRLVEGGTHEELMEMWGVYYQMWQKQSGFAISEDGHQAEVEADRLKAIPLLAGLNEDYLVEIASRFVTERFDEGEEILLQGELGYKFCIIVRGSVDVVATDQADDEHHMAMLEVGDYFGEIALLADVAITASVRAHTPTVCLTLLREQFYRLMDETPELRSAIAPVMSKRLEETEAVQQLGSRSEKA